MTDRKNGPAAHLLTNTQLMRPQKADISSGLPLFIFHSPGSGVFRLEIYFHAGDKYQSFPLQARLTAAMMTEGTRSYSSSQIADAFDSLGASIQCESSFDYTTIIIYGLTKNAHLLVKPVEEIISACTFPEKELEILRSNAIERYRVNTQKVEFLARQHFMAVLLGEDKNYSKVITEKDYQSMDCEKLSGYYNDFISGHPFMIVASGDVDESFLGPWKNMLQKNRKKTDQPRIPFVNVQKGKKNHVEKKDAIQSAIRIGQPVISRHHPDFAGLQVLNLILGGYFGSRLMSNIREEKGYTYGIGSAIVAFRDFTYVVISTEVGSDVCASALGEIYYEIKRLGEEPVPEEELKLAKNYMLGSFIRNSDGPFAMADRFKNIYLDGLDYDYYDDYLQVVSTISQEEIKDLVLRYFNPRGWIEIIAGKK